jgi:phosphoribosylformylglycinamidine synthase
MPHHRTLILRTAGTNCDTELARAFALAGSTPDLLHQTTLAKDPDIIDRYNIVALPGGFAHGDDIAAGRVLAAFVRDTLYEKLIQLIDREGAVLGVCNGFQVLVQIGLLPGPTQPNPTHPSQPPLPTVALAENTSNRFICEWTPLAANPAANCIWTEPLKQRPPHEPPLAFPIAHAEGRLIAPDPGTIEHITANNRDALRYTHNPNGSEASIAALTDHTGRVLGLMPHPERFPTWRHHPDAPNLHPSLRHTETPALAMFRAAVERTAALTHHA